MVSWDMQSKGSMKLKYEVLHIGVIIPTLFQQRNKETHMIRYQL